MIRKWLEVATLCIGGVLCMATSEIPVGEACGDQGLCTDGDGDCTAPCPEPPPNGGGSGGSSEPGPEGEPAPDAADAEPAPLEPGDPFLDEGEGCGAVTCPVDQGCCDPLRGVCAPFGGSCRPGGPSATR